MVADRTYHRLLMLDWIRTDVDGDGLGEYVPYTVIRPVPIRRRNATNSSLSGQDRPWNPA